MYRCVSRDCDENDYTSTGQNDVILHNREKEIAFRARILLSCGHSVCEQCIYTGVTIRRENFYKCDDCGKITGFSQRTVEKIKFNKPRLKEIVRWNEDGAEDLNYEAFSIGAAFNSGRISITATPVVDLDESQPEILSISSHSYREEPEVRSIATKITHAPEQFKAIVNEGVTMYQHCCKSLRHLFDAKTAVNKKYVATKEAIRKRFHLLHGLLQLEEASLMQELNKTQERNIKLLQEKEKEIDSVRNNLKSAILRSPRHVSIVVGNPTKNEILSIRQKRLKVDAMVEMPDHLISLNKPHDELHECLKKLVDFRKAVQFDVKIPFSPLTSNQTFNVPATPESVFKAKPKQPSISHINYDRQLLTTIHEVKESGYFSAFLPSDEAASASLSKALLKWCNLFRHPPITSKIKPGSDCVIWHDQKKEWVRAKFKCLAEFPRQSDKENYSLTSHNLKPKKVEVSLTDYNDELYKTRFENLRESSSQLTDPTTYPKLIKVLKCRLRNVQPVNSNIRTGILTFCARNVKVKLLINGEPVNDIYDVDIVHDIPDTSNPQPSLIEHLILAAVARLKDGKEMYPYPIPSRIYKQYPKFPNLQVDRSYSVHVMSIESPNRFTIAIARERAEVEKIEKKLEEIYSHPDAAIVYRLYFPRVFVPCAARCELFFDKKKKLGKKIYHRGYIPKLEPELNQKNIYSFLAVDYGEVIKVSLTDLRVIPDSFITLPKQSIKCSLTDVAPIDNKDWSQNAINHFTEYFQASNLLTSIHVKSLDGGRVNVILTIHNFEGDQDGIVNDILVKDGFAQKGNCNVSNDATAKDATIPIRNLPNKLDFSCYNLLREMLSKFKKYSLGHVDSLIPVKVTCFNSPDSFFIQIDSPEVQNDIKAYLKRLDEEHTHIDVSRANPQSSMQAFSPGDLCIYLYRPSNGPMSWRRGLILEYLGGDKTLNNPDPRQIKQVSGNVKYKVKNRDSGIVCDVLRRYMLHPPPSSPYLRDGDKCVQVFIPGIKPTNGSWTLRVFNHFKGIITNPQTQLFIKIEDILEENTPEKIPVDLIFKTRTTVDIFSPVKVNYNSFRYDLIDNSYAHAISDELHYDKEIEMDDDSKYVNRRIPFTMTDNSAISSLKASFYSDTPTPEVTKYMQSETPTTPNFEAICTHAEYEPSIWFTIRNDRNNEPTIGTINKTILHALIQTEKLTPFKGNADRGRACTVHADNRWWRAEIIDVSVDNKINVLCVDTGFKRQCYLEQISSEVFCEGIPKLAMQGRLNMCKTFSRRTDAPEKLFLYLRDNVVKKNIRVHWENHYRSPMLISVTLEENSRDLKQMLLNLDLIEESQESATEYPQYIQTSIELMNRSDLNFPRYEFSSVDFYPVIVADVVTENYLYLQIANFDNPDIPQKREINDLYAKFREFEIDLNSNVVYFQRAADFSVGCLCCAKWKDEWFRGIVREVVEPGAKYKVLFVDWGNSDTVDLNDMRILPEDYGIRGVSVFGFFARLSNIKPARNGMWTSRLFDMMKLMINNAMDSNHDLVVRFNSHEIPFDVEMFTANAAQQPVKMVLSGLVDMGYLETC